MEKHTILTLVFVILFGRPKLAYGETPWRSFCESGKPLELDQTAGEGKGEVVAKELTTVQSWLIHVNKNNSQGIDLNLHDYELEDFFLVIQDGCTNTNPDSMIQFISGKSSKAMNFRIPFGKSFHVEICPEILNFNKILPAKFNLTFKRIDRFQEDGLPDDGVQQDSYEIQLKGHTIEKFKDDIFRERFREALRNIAKDYCKDFDIDFNDLRTTEEMVKILKVSQCPPEWFESSCVSIEHSIYVSKERDSDTMRAFEENELKIKNLIRMWELCGNKYIGDIGLSVFRLKDKNNTIGWWLTTFTLPLILFTMVVIITKKVCHNFFIHPEKNFSTTTNSKVREKQMLKGLKPNKFQTVPSFMKNAKKSGRGDVTDSYNTASPKYSAAILYCMDRLIRTKSGNSSTESAL